MIRFETDDMLKNIAKLRYDKFIFRIIKVKRIRSFADIFVFF